MTDLQSWVAPTYHGLADLLAAAPAETWDAPSLCARWQVRHVVAHVTMPVRLTPEQFGAEMAAAGGDFCVLSVDFALDEAKGFSVTHCERSEAIAEFGFPNLARPFLRPFRGNFFGRRAVVIWPAILWPIGGDKR